MRELLLLLAEKCYFLFDIYKAHIIDSRVFDHFGDAIIRIEVRCLRLHFIRDRGRLELNLSPLKPKRKTEQYAIGIVQELLSHVHEDDAVDYSQADAAIEESTITYLENEFDNILSLFEPDNIEETRRQIDVLLNARVKRAGW